MRTVNKYVPIDIQWLTRAAVEMFLGDREARRIFGPRGPGRWNPNSRTACDCGRKAKP